MENAREDDGTLGPCGCVDYHMADCPLRTSARDLEMNEFYTDPYGNPDNPFDGPDNPWEQ